MSLILGLPKNKNNFQSPAAPKARDGDTATPSVCLRTNSKTHSMYFLGCCVFFDINGMLQFVLNLLNIEFFFFFLIFHVFFAFHAISATFRKKFGVKKKLGGGGGSWKMFFLGKQFFLISCFMLFSTLKKYIEKCHFTYWLYRMWFLQILVVVDRDSWNLYPLYPLFPCSDFVSQLWGGRG